MFQKILVANRGEIALRVICACKELGISTVAVYSEADRNSLHVRFADEAVCIGPPRSSESYLNIPQVISAAEITNVDAIHPGYGFLSENANFAKVCEASEIAFIGPRPEIIEMMGEKDRARREVRTAGLPTIPGSEGIVEGEEQLAKEAAHIGYPLILKASAGGGVVNGIGLGHCCPECSERRYCESVDLPHSCRMVTPSHWRIGTPSIGSKSECSSQRPLLEASRLDAYDRVHLRT